MWLVLKIFTFNIYIYCTFIICTSKKLKNVCVQCHYVFVCTSHVNAALRLLYPVYLILWLSCAIIFLKCYSNNSQWECIKVHIDIYLLKQIFKFIYYIVVSFLIYLNTIAQLSKKNFIASKLKKKQKLCDLYRYFYLLCLV